VPLYEYRCRSCQQPCELLVRTGDVPACPACGSTDLERLLSAFGVSTSAVRQASVAKARVAHRASQKDKAIADREEREHHHH